jgi:hypothetical protein
MYSPLHVVMRDDSLDDVDRALFTTGATSIGQQKSLDDRTNSVLTFYIKYYFGMFVITIL